MKVSIEVVRHQLITAAAKVVDVDEAAYFADMMLLGHLHKAPRMNPLKDAVEDLDVWHAAEVGGPALEVDRASILLLDFKGLAPSLKIKYVHDQLTHRARANGLAAVGFRNSSGIITLDPWAEGLARRDLIGLVMFNGGTGCTVPFGGSRGVFGTLPLAYAVPTAGEPLALDMALTEIPFFQIKHAKERSLPLPPGAAVDGRGRPTTDAAAALSDDGVANLLPLGGGFKGYGLVMLVEVLTGSLVRSLLSTKQTPGWNPREYGGLLLALDVASFTDLDRFKREISEMCASIRRQPPAEGAAEIAIPGDRSHRKAAAARAQGVVEVDDVTAQALQRLAGSD